MRIVARSIYANTKSEIYLPSAGTYFLVSLDKVGIGIYSGGTKILKASNGVDPLNATDTFSGLMIRLS